MAQMVCQYLVLTIALTCNILASTGKSDYSFAFAVIYQLSRRLWPDLIINIKDRTKNRFQFLYNKKFESQDTLGYRPSNQTLYTLDGSRDFLDLSDCQSCWFESC